MDTPSAYQTAEKMLNGGQAGAVDFDNPEIGKALTNLRLCVWEVVEQVIAAMPSERCAHANEFRLTGRGIRLAIDLEPFSLVAMGVPDEAGADPNVIFGWTPSLGKKHSKRS